MDRPEEPGLEPSTRGAAFQPPPVTEADGSKKITLRPPEWSGAAGRTDRRVTAPPPPLERHQGNDAPEGRLRARLDAARATGNVLIERDAALALARFLVSSGRGMDESVSLARRALELHDDPDLRVDLASWLEGLGDPKGAAEAMRPLAAAQDVDGVDAAAALVRVGVLLARAGDAVGANEAWIRALHLDPMNATASELRGTLHAWAPDILTSTEAAEAYVEAASRRFSAGALDAQFEDLLRAFDVDTTSSVAVAALSIALIERNKALAADEVWRAHAAALQPHDARRAAAVHARRRLQARAAGDVSRAFGAALDEQLDAQFTGEAADVMDDLLLRVGLLEPLAARLELRGERARGADRARALEELARLLAGPLASPERAAVARVLAVEADPSREDSIVALRAYASTTRDATDLVEALIRAVGNQAGVPDSPGRRAARALSARALAALAEEQLADPALASWAFEMLRRLDPSDPAPAQAGIARNAARDAARREEISFLRRDLELAKGAARREPLVALAALLRSDPEQSELFLGILGELVALAPDEKKWRAEAYRIALRRRDHAEVSRLASEQMAKARTVVDVVEGRLALATAARMLGDTSAANDATRPLLDDAPAHRQAAAFAWANAGIANDERTRARAIVELSTASGSTVRAVMLAFAAEALWRLGDADAARPVAERASQADPANPRCVSTLGGIVSGYGDRTAASALERTINIVGARSSWCSALADALEALGELGHAIGWTQRALALAPGDRRLMHVLFQRLLRARDADRMADALSWAMSQPQPAAPLGEIVASGLRGLVAVDQDRAVVLARRMLDAFGAKSSIIRETIIGVAEAGKDEFLAVLALERALSGSATGERLELFLSLGRKRRAMGDHAGEARVLARALREGIAAAELDKRVVEVPRASLEGDGLLAVLEARAEVLAGGEDRAGAALALRELGAALWDVAGDRIAAVRAWMRAARMAPFRGYVTLGVDLARFAGSRYALDCLSELIEKESDRARAGAIAAEAARAALALEEASRAFDLAAVALDRNPSHADALEIAERSAVAASRAPEMSRVYEALGARALGRFGCRAAHYRGARFFEQRADPGLALKHAALAFCAVPSEGAPFFLLKRTAERADDRAEAVRTVIQVADATKSSGARAAWLLRAATIASADEEGARLKVDVLLRAVLLVPDAGTLTLLVDASRELLRIAPEEREAIQVRLSRASRTVSAKADGPEGARVAIAFASLGLQLFSDADWAWRALDRAMRADPDLDEYALLQMYASLLAQAEGAAELLERLIAYVEQPYTNIGMPALDLLAAIAAASGDMGPRARVEVLAVERDGEDLSRIRNADKLAMALGDDSLLRRLRKKVPDARRAAAFHALAREKLADGLHDEAIKALERVCELAEGPDLATAERELAVAYASAGRAEELEARALREATLASLESSVRAARWTEVARHREDRGDLVGAVDALLAAANLDGAPIERWTVLERAAELARLDDVRIGAIREIAGRVDPEARIAVLKRLALAHEARADSSAAEATWQDVLRLSPDDEEADHAIEVIISARADYSDLANHLNLRAEKLSRATGMREALRAVRLRRAAILEQRLSRTQDACEELLLVLRESPDNASAMSYLADLYERMGEHGRAAPLWSRVAVLSRDPRSQVELEIRAARAFIAARDYTTARALVVSILERDPGRRDAAELRVDVARALDDPRALGDALEDLVTTSTDDAVTRSDALVEACHAAARASDMQSALRRAQRAARLAPERAETQLLARNLEYRVRGAGTPDEAKRTIEELARLGGKLRRDDAAMQAFLTAEALDAFQGGGAGMRTLADREAHIGRHPLIELGMAERFVAQYNFAEALPRFQAALFGDLSAVRDRGRVALAAADAAFRAERPDSALRLLDDAAGEPSTMVAACMRKAQLYASKGDRRRACATLRELAATTEGEERARSLAQLGRMLLASEDGVERAEAEGAFERAMEAAPAGSVLESQLLAEREARGGPPPVDAPDSSADAEGARARPEPRFATPPPALPAEAVVAQAEPGPPSVDFQGLEAGIAGAHGTRERSHARLRLAEAHLARGAVGAAELCLNEGLAEGGLDEGVKLTSLLERYPERAAELVRVRRRMTEVAPGDLSLLEGLRAAAALDRNAVYARAVEHVARAFDPGAGPLPPPPLAAQTEHPGLLHILTRAAGDRASLALALVWEGAHLLLTREPAAYGLTGAERVAAGAPSPLGRTYDVALRLLDVPRIPLFVRKASATSAPTRVALLWPCAAVVGAKAAEDSPEGRVELGRSMSAAMPHNALLLGPSESEAKTVWSAVLGAFGPPEHGRPVDSASARLAENFWQTLAPRTQRRLQEILASSGPSDFDVAIERARQSGWRVALFLTGDFALVVSALVADLDPGAGPVTADNLGRFCQTVPGVSDLFALAISPEYADARWQPMAPASRRGTMAGGRLSSF